MNNHAKFLEHLEASRGAVNLVAEWIRGMGYQVTVPEMRQAPNHSEWMEYADRGDLYVGMRVEVKHLGYDFTSAEDWPFGDQFIVCAVHAFRRARPKPYAFIYLSRDKTHAAIVMGRHHKRWTTGRRKDSRYHGVEQEYYFSPMGLIKFISLT